MHAGELGRAGIWSHWGSHGLRWENDRDDGSEFAACLEPTLGDEKWWELAFACMQGSSAVNTSGKSRTSLNRALQAAETLWFLKGTGFSPYVIGCNRVRL
jgi:hypothetical protein